MGRTSHEDRFRTLVHRRLEPGETIVATARVWTARPSKIPVLAARYRDDAVVTDRRLMVWATGWWTRRARRRVLADRLDAITITNPSQRRVRVDHDKHPPVVFDVANDEAGRRFAAALLAARDRAATSATT